MIQDDYDYEFPDDIDYDYDFDDDDTPKPIVKDGFVYRNEEHAKQQAQPLTYKGKPIYTEDDIKTAEIQIDKAYKRADVLHILNIIFVPYNKVFLPLWLVICIAIGKLNIFIGGVIIFGGLLHLLYIGRASRWNTYKEKLSKKKLERYVRMMLNSIRLSVESSVQIACQIVEGAGNPPPDEDTLRELLLSIVKESP